LPGLSPAEVRALIEEGTVALDVRPGDQFAAGHVPGSINIALSGQFATWAGTILGLATRPVLIADGDEQVGEARLRLSRVGIDAERGFLAGGVNAWTKAGFALATVAQVTAQELRQRWPLQGVQLLDVRREPEWNAGHISNAQIWPLDKFAAQLPDIDKSTPVIVHCKSGYRSMIACSLLKKAGHTAVTNLIGGYDAWEQIRP
jgi:rhodanese-related sulfurtransferase